MRRPPAYPFRTIPRPPLRHIYRTSVSEAELHRRTRGLADQGDRVSLIRDDGQRFTIVRNGERYLARDAQDRSLVTADTIEDCIALADEALNAAKGARARREADFGHDDPRGAA